MKKISMFLVFVAVLTLPFSNAHSEWQSVSSAGVTFDYRVTEDSLHLEGIMTGQTTGWVAVGFNPTFMMNNANIIIGYAENQVGFIRDDWGVGNTSHVSDVSLDGTDDVTLIDAFETEGVTTIHFSIPLDSGDQYDQPLTIGETYPIILARGHNGANNFTSFHAAAGMTEISLQEPTYVEDDNIIVFPGISIRSIYPNPFESKTKISYNLQENSQVRLSIYNLKGQLVHRVVKNVQRGEHNFIWQTKNLSSGTYFIQLHTENGFDSKRFTVIKH